MRIESLSTGRMELRVCMSVGRCVGGWRRVRNILCILEGFKQHKKVGSFFTEPSPSYNLLFIFK